MGTLQSCMEPSPWVLLAAKLRKKGQALPCSSGSPVLIDSEAESKSLTKTTQNGESKDSLSKHVCTVGVHCHKALGHHPESGRIYDKAFVTRPQVKKGQRPWWFLWG